MSPSERVLYERLRRRALGLQPDLARRLLASYDIIRSVLTEAELARAIQAGHVESLINELLADDVLDPAFQPLRAMVDQAVLDAARAGTKDLPKTLQIELDILNPRIIEMARKLDTRVVEGLKAEVRETVRQHVISGIEAGQNPRAVARGVKRVVGLAPRHQRAVANFRRELETGDRAALNRVLGRGVIRQPDGTEIVRRAHADQQGVTGRDMGTLASKLGRSDLTAEQVARMTEAYRKRLVALNAETQTRTMSLDAMRAGARGSWEDAIAQGTVDRSMLRRVWVAVDDDRTRPEHREMDGTEVEFDTPYPNGQMVPGETDFNCRCIERIILAREAVVA